MFMVNKEPRYKLNWVLIIFLIPAGGFILYFLWGSKREFSWFNRRFRRAEHEIGELLPIRMETETRCYEDVPNEAPLGRYLPGRAIRCTKTRGRSFSFRCGYVSAADPRFKGGVQKHSH